MRTSARSSFLKFCSYFALDAKLCVCMPGGWACLQLAGTPIPFASWNVGQEGLVTLPVPIPFPFPEVQVTVR